MPLIRFLSCKLGTRLHTNLGTCVIASTVVTASLVLGGCSSSPLNFAPDFSWAYRPDIQQGTIITKDMADKLQTGMTRDQVRFILGTPAIADLFHANRWDYPYRFQPGRGDSQERNFAVFFEDNKLVRTESDPLPTEEEFRKTQKAGELPAPPDEPGKSLWQRLKGVLGA